MSGTQTVRRFSGLWVAGILFASTLALGSAACGSSTPEPETASEQGSDDGPRHSGPALDIQAEVGALNEEKVQATFQKVAPKFESCFGDGMARIPYMSGRVEFEIRVDQSGGAKAVILKDSTLGDRETEDCMLTALRRASWPAPEGGKEGVAQNSFEFDPGGGTRAPVAWSAADLGDELEEARADLSACRSGASTGPLKATMYVETDGAPKSIGLSVSDASGEEAVACVVRKLKEITFPSPGSYASKVSFTID